MPNAYCEKQVCTDAQLEGVGERIAESDSHSLHYLPLNTRPQNPVVAVIKPHPSMGAFEIFSDELRKLSTSYLFSTHKALENTAYADFKNSTLPLLDAIGLNSVLGKRFGINIYKSFLFFPENYRASPVVGRIYFTYLVRCPVKRDGDFDPKALPGMQRCVQEKFLPDIQQYQGLELALWLCGETTKSFVQENLLGKLEAGGIKSLLLPDPHCNEDVQKFLESPTLEESRSFLEKILLK